jgi:glycosyltransferase involved in cell wall biosynthesis
LTHSIPIVYSGAGEGADIIKEICAGVVTPPEDEKAFAEAVIWLAEHPKEAYAMGGRGRTYAEKNLDWNVLVKKWLRDVQERIIQDKGKIKNAEKAL